MKITWHVMAAATFVIGIASAGALAAGWSIQVVDTPQSGYMAGVQSSVKFDSQRKPCIAYWVRRNTSDWPPPSSLKYARFDGAGWQIQTVDNVGSVGAFPSLAIDGAGHPRISYDDSTNKALKYAAYDGGAWHTQTALSVDCRDTSLALDSAGNPRIAYYNYGNFDIRTLEYASLGGLGWNRQTVDSTTGVGIFASMALDNSGNPRIAYWDNTHDSVRYAAYDGSSWSIQTVDSSHYMCGTSLALDANGNPHLSYYGSVGSQIYLKHAYWTGTAWTIENIEMAYNGFYWETNTSLVFGPDGKPRICYLGGGDTGNGLLKYAAWDGSKWTTQIVDTGINGAFGTMNSMAVDPNGNVGISYFGQHPMVLKYAYLAVPEPSPLLTLFVGLLFPLAGYRTHRKQTNSTGR